MLRLLSWHLLPAAILLWLFFTGQPTRAAAVFLMLGLFALIQLSPAIYRSRHTAKLRDGLLQAALFLLATMVAALETFVPRADAPENGGLFLLQLGIFGLAMLLNPEHAARTAGEEDSRPSRAPAARWLYVAAAMAFALAALIYVGQRTPGFEAIALHPAVAGVGVAGILVGIVLFLRILRQYA